MKNAGVQGVMRYLAPPEAIYDWKRITPEERDLIHSAGLDLYLVFQAGNNGVDSFNYGTGLQHGTLARDMVGDLGAPPSLPIYFPVDFGASDDQMRETIVHYFNGVYDGLALRNPMGIYGGYWVCRYAQRHWAGVRFYWQTVAWSPRVDGAPIELGGTHGFQHDTPSFAGSDLIDLFGHPVDLNHFYHRGWGTQTSVGHEHHAEVILR